MQKLRSIQVLRGVAATAVVTLHAYGETTDGRITFAHHGGAGVDLFFVISGFIMASVGAGKRPEAFLADRARRIYPLWLIALAPWLLIGPLTAGILVSSLTLWPIYGGAFQTPALGVGWTLCFEMLFYLAFALALATRAWVPLALYAACFILAILTMAATFRFLGNPLACEFLMGAAIARLPRREFLGPALAFSGLAIILSSPAVLVNFTVVMDPARSILRLALWGLPAAAVVYGILSMETRLPSLRPLVFLGDASYAIYLFHPIVLYALHLPWPVEVLAAVAAGSAVHVLIERRLLAWLRHPLGQCPHRMGGRVDDRQDVHAEYRPIISVATPCQLRPDGLPCDRH